MPWVSNRTGADISVSFTYTSGGGTYSDTRTIPPAILYKTSNATAPENSGKNYWPRNTAETITVTKEGGQYSFTVQANDHVDIYTDSYETYPASFSPGNK
jgi:hypothetical protein